MSPPARDPAAGPGASQAPRGHSGGWSSWALAAACGAFLGLVAFWSAPGGDWFISETHAHVLYDSLRRFGEFPYFSFFLNQGSYLIQDPQFPGLSIVTPLVLALGPEAGLRAAAVLFGAAGWWCTAAWLRRRVSRAAAAFGAAAWTLSLGILWRIAVGNDIFLWMLALPAFLLLAEEAILRPTARAGIGLGLATGIFLLGPTFHAAVYLVVPASLVWCALLLGTQLARRRLGWRVWPVLGQALLVAAVIASPRLLAWSALSMRRPIEADGTMPMSLALESLLAPWKTSPHEMLPIVGEAIAGGVRLETYAIWEGSAALPHLATVLAALSILSPRVRRSRAALLSALLLAIGLALTTSTTLWDAVRSAAPFVRISRRTLVMAGFGLAVLSAFGYEVVEARAGRWARAWQALALLAVAASTSAWIRGSVADGRLRPGSTPLWSHPVAAAPAGPSGPLLEPFSSPAALGAGRLLGGGFHSVGNPCEGVIYGGIACTSYQLRFRQSPFGAGARPVALGASAPVALSHTTVSLAPLPAGGGAVLALVARPHLGYEVEPAGASVVLGGRDELLSLRNVGPASLAGVRVTARSPVPSWLWWGWGAAVVTAAAFLLRGPSPRPPGPGSAAERWNRAGEAR